MNVGPNREQALAQAWANSKVDSKPRYLHKYGGVYWLEPSPPDNDPNLGHQGSDYIAVFPEGNYVNFDPTKGAPHVNPHGKRNRSPA